MAECAISGQTVVTQHYCRFVTTDGGEQVVRFYALGSPPPVDAWTGTVQTAAVDVGAVAADIAAIGRPGRLTWSPRLITHGTEILAPLHPIRINIGIYEGLEGEALVESIRGQIAAGGKVRVERRIIVPDEGVLTVQVDQVIYPPFRGLVAA